MKESHRVLIVDDEPAVRWTLALVFQRGGIETDVAENGREAMSLLKRTDCAYCAVILDLNVPPPDGIEIAKYIRDSCSDVPVVAISGYPDLTRRLENENVGSVVRQIVAKPVDGAQIFNYVHAVHCIRSEVQQAPTAGAVRSD